MTECNDIFNLRFNYDHEFFTCSMESGVKIFNVEPVAQTAYYDTNTVGSVSMCEMSFHTNIIAVVSGGSRPKIEDNVLTMYNENSRQVYDDIQFPSTIKNVRMTKKYLVVTLINRIYVYSLPKVQKICMLLTRDNPKGLCAITPLSEAYMQLLVFPGQNLGSVQLANLSSCETGVLADPVCIQAHKSEVGSLAISQLCSKIATASVKGMMIRVWDTTTNNLLVELRRGNDIATIHCMNFCKQTEYLCCSSDKGTVHVFAVMNTSLNRRSSIPGGFLVSYLDSQWSFANFKVPTIPSICTFGADKTVIVICLDGSYYKYKFTHDGECSQEIFVYL